MRGEGEEGEEEKKTALFKNRGRTFGDKIPNKMALYSKFQMSHKSFQSEALFNLINHAVHESWEMSSDLLI